MTIFYIIIPCKALHWPWPQWLGEESLNISTPINSPLPLAEAPPLKAQPGLMSVFYSLPSLPPPLMRLRKQQKQVRQMMPRAGANKNGKKGAGQQKWCRPAKMDPSRKQYRKAFQQLLPSDPKLQMFQKLLKMSSYQNLFTLDKSTILILRHFS